MRLPLGTGVGEFAQACAASYPERITTGGNSSRVSLIYMVSLLLAAWFAWVDLGE
jgi:hypothetical protein